MKDKEDKPKKPIEKPQTQETELPKPPVTPPPTE